MITLFGELTVMVNDKPIQIFPVEISNTFRHYKVDKRYLIKLSGSHQVGKKTTIKFELSSQNFDNAGATTGQNLAQITFERNKGRMSIGTIGDVAGITYSYFKYGIQLEIAESVEYEEFIFIIAWCSSSAIDAASTEFLADPSWHSWQFLK